MSRFEPGSLYLVQRVRLRPKDQRSSPGESIDGVFSFDYMGSAEFEFGVLPAALRGMRASTVSPPVKVHSGVFEAWYVGKSEFQAQACLFFDTELSDSRIKPYRLKERSELRESFQPRSDFERHQAPVDGWWALDVPRTWALFRTEEAANLWFSCLRLPSSGGAGKVLLAKILTRTGVTDRDRKARRHR